MAIGRQSYQKCTEHDFLKTTFHSLVLVFFGQISKYADYFTCEFRTVLKYKHLFFPYKYPEHNSENVLYSR